MTRSRRSLVPLPELVTGLIKAQGLEIRMMEYSLQQQWCTIVGPHIAGHTYPEAIRHRKLYLLAENSVWLQQLLFLKSELMTKIAGAIGQEVLSDIVLRVGFLAPVTSPPDIEPEPMRGPHGLGTELLSFVEDALVNIADGPLTERLRALFLKSARFTSVQLGSETVSVTHPPERLLI
jgi:hypothetical protein